MRNRLLGLAVLSILTVFSASSSIVAQQRGTAATAAPKLPPIVYICPMAGHEDVLEEKPGICPLPKCGMQLEAARLDSKWWCPTHQTLSVADGPGKCRMRDGKDLVQVTLMEWWTCPGSTNKLMDPGKCGDGSERRIKYEIRAHGDHNPRHGGQFFMAEDRWHHIEGTYPSAGLFRVYFYDNYTKPMSAKDFTAQLVILDKSFKETASYPMKVGADGTTMEGQVPANQAALPLNAAVRITFGTGKKPQLFNFPFNAYSKEPVAGTPTGGAGGARQQAQAAVTSTPFIASAAPSKPFSFRDLATAPAQAPAGGQAQAPRILDSPLQISAELAAALDEERLPKDTPGIISALETRSKEIGQLITDGAMGQAWLPAMGAKTAALVLESKSKDLAEPKRIVAAESAKRIVAAAWEIDEFGDLGNRDKLNDAYMRLTAAVAELKGAYEAR